MPITAFVVACLGPLCSYSASPQPFDTVAQCERAAPVMAGIARSGMTELLWVPTDTSRRLAFRCIDVRTGEVLMSFDSADQVAAARPATPLRD
ncbi:hypothetical protein [Magnetospirillum sp. UT-4]|uniref:hypothetical protein n=1 Tax=Magnetospirillum sp. UT-4 TaxID=2681467 RepID=UPI0015737EE4|nr:hypothetical protein [Magnetospirillum sp. UT-4]